MAHSFFPIFHPIQFYFGIQPDMAAGVPENYWDEVWASGLKLALFKVLRLKQLMQEHGMSPDPARMYMDCEFASNQIALAHLREDEELKSLSMEFFEPLQMLYHQRSCLAHSQKFH